MVLEDYEDNELIEEFTRRKIKNFTEEAERKLKILEKEFNTEQREIIEEYLSTNDLMNILNERDEIIDVLSWFTVEDLVDSINEKNDGYIAINSETVKMILDLKFWIDRGTNPNEVNRLLREIEKEILTL